MFDDSSKNGLRRRTALAGLATLGGFGVATGTMKASTIGGDNNRIGGEQGPDEQLSAHTDAAEAHRAAMASELIGDVADAGQLNRRNDDEAFRTRLYELEEDREVVPFGYTKGLESTPDGFVVGEVYDEFVDAATTGSGSYPVESRPLISPPAATSYAMDGTDPWLGVTPPAYDADSSLTKAELLEAYAAAVCQDVPFSEYETLTRDANGDDEEVMAWAFDRDIDRFLDDDETLSDWIESPGAGTQPFRDRFTGCDVGPYVSQHLHHDVAIGAYTLDPRITPIDDADAPFGTTESAWRAIVRGQTGGAEPGPQPNESVETGEKRYVATGADLASIVRSDPAYQPYVFATLQLFEWDVPFDSVPHQQTDGVHPYLDGGVGAILDLVSRVCRNALLSAWHHKWAIHRRIRPETYAGRVAFANKYYNSSTLRLSDLLVSETPFVATDEGYLPLAYPEGAPAHPAYPSGHSVIAGACVTVLKTFFDDVPIDDVVPGDLLRATPDGSELESVSDADLDVSLTTHGELNKLASNLGLGRQFAGVHYRTDHIYGMLLGEQIAVATLYHHLQSVHTDGAAEMEFTPLLESGSRQPTVATFEALRQKAADREGLRP